MRDIDTAVVDSLKVLDPNRPIREADMSFARRVLWHIGYSIALNARGCGL